MTEVGLTAAPVGGDFGSRSRSCALGHRLKHRRDRRTAVAVVQHLHSMITEVGYNDKACTVESEAEGLVELTSA
jgi:hypothetical protein